jgi:uncharacterized membrane protein YkvA (DUF1232 family)
MDLIMKDDNAFEAAYSDGRFRDKLKRYAKIAGWEVVEKALLLFYASQEEKAPAWAKTTIAAALGYFIVPLDAITDLAPGIGYADDLGVLVLAIAAVSRYINDDVRAKTTKRMRAWFGEKALDGEYSQATPDTEKMVSGD